jgi:LysR family transcriptional regulator, transcriptional activator of the cysJI operon
MHLNLHLLRIFFTVAERKSFSRAAEALFVSQPAVSKAVRELEHQLDLPLLERGGAGAKGVRLTADGAALFDHARGIFALERAATEDLRARVGVKRGRLSVAASTTIAGYWLPSYAAEFFRKFPSIELSIGVGNTQIACQGLIECEFDLALVEGPVDDPRIVATHWRDDRLRIVAHPDAAVARRRKPTLQEVSDQLWLVREPGSGTRDATERMMRQHGISPGRTIQLGSNEGIARAVASGLGIAMLPALVLRELIGLEQIRPVNYPSDLPLRRPLSLLQLKERPASPAVRAFCDVLQRRLEDPQ